MELVLDLPEQIDFEMIDTKRFIAAKLYEVGKLSLGQAAELVGLSKIAFSELLKDYNVSLINYSFDEAIFEAAKL